MTFHLSQSVANAAAMTSISTASGYRIVNDPTVLTTDRPPRSRRRPDPLDGVFDNEVVPLLLAAPGLRAIAVFDELQRRHTTLSPGIRRTLERRIRAWRAVHGPEQDVIFRQVHPPGQLGLSDFTDANDLHVTIDGAPFSYLLYHFRLAYSGFAHVHIVPGGESFASLARGLQGALWSLGGVPHEHRTDSLSAAFRNLDRAARDDLTERYTALCEHYGMTPSRNQRGVAHENGSIEGPHGHLKRAIEDVLLLRGSRNFVDVDDYRAFLDELMSQRNARVQLRIDAERSCLRALPAQPHEEGEVSWVFVTRSSGFTLRRVFYSVPSRLIGHRLRVVLQEDHLDLFMGGTKLLTLARGRAGAQGKHGHVVDYRHVIHALRRKPMALMNLVYRDQLFPRLAYKRAFELLLARTSAAIACRTLVDLLLLAHMRGCEAELAAHLDALIDAGTLPDLKALTACFTPDPTRLPEITVATVSLSTYEVLLDGMTNVSTAAFV